MARVSVLLFLILAGVLWARADVAPEGISKGGSQLVVWVDGNGKEAARAWFGFEFGSETHATRLLLELADGTRLILSKQHYPLEGKERYGFREVRSGWWIELEEESPFLRYDSVEQISQTSVMVEKFSAADHPVKVRISASGLASFQMSSTIWNELRHHQFFEQLKSEGLADEFATGMAPSVRAAIRTLEELLETQPSFPGLFDHRNLIGFLVTTLDHIEPETRAVPHGTESWSSRVLDHWEGTAIEDPAVRAFATKFSVRLDQPLLDSVTPVAAGAVSPSQNLP
jgi:hypothetical protein